MENFIFCAVSDIKKGIRIFPEAIQGQNVLVLRYFTFEPKFKLRWCRDGDLLGPQIPVTTGGFELRTSCIQSSYLTH